MSTSRAELEQQIAGVAALNEPVRRSLYLYVAEQNRDVSRDEAATAVGITRALAAFHLDKLEEEGLLSVRYRRLTGRSGPGAGRPSKLYRRSARQIDLTLPPRSYELAARLFARALEGGERQRLNAVACDFGAALGKDARQEAGPDASPERLLAAAEQILDAYGFEPHRSRNGEVRLSNCPFHSLAQEHRDMVCGMNLCLMQGVISTLNLPGVEAVLDPQPGACCVAFRRTS